MNIRNLIGKNILYKKMGGTGYGKIVIASDFSDNVMVKVKDERTEKLVSAYVNIKDIIKIYG